MRSSDNQSVLIYSGSAALDEALHRSIAAAVDGVAVQVAGTEAALHALLPETDVLLAWGVPAGLLAAAVRLRWLATIGAGVDDLVAAKHLLHGVTVTNIRGPFGRPMAEHILTYTLAHFQRVREVLAAQRAHLWNQFIPDRLEGKTFGIAGLGSVGAEIAKLCSAVGARVIGVRRSSGSVPHVERVYAPTEVSEFLSRSDVLVLCLPATAETHGFMSLERLSMLKRTAFVVNVGRGSALPAEHLVAALDRGLIAGAAVDVFEDEPLPRASPLWDRPDVIVTPHISGINRPQDVCESIVANLRRYVAGEPLENVVDLERGY